MKSIGLEGVREKEHLAELKSVLQIISNWMAIPLFLLFWIADVLYIPELKWQFLAIRIAVVPVCIAVNYYARKLESLSKLRNISLFYAIAMASGINLMIWFIPDPGTPYYAGLGLVSIGALSFIPFSKRQFFAATMGIYLPYYVTVLTKSNGQSEAHSVLINSFFIVSSICMCFLIRFFQEGLRDREIKARHQLNQELMNREEIIRIKAAEAIRLNTLYSQFSPQIVESIKSGKLKLEAGGQRAQICAIFIDIVNSTERVTRIDKDKVEKVLSKFLDDTIKILLKYDITIDKFLGDGLLGFCNAPLKRADYVARVVKASLEVREKIAQDQDFFERYWQAPMQIRVGIARGFVNVGFYGSQKYFRSYTAIGPVVNLASRLCSSADPGQILVDYDVFEEIKDEFEAKFVGKKVLKGFDQDIIHTYEVMASQIPTEKNLMGVSDCATCGGLLTLENNDKGQFVFMCKSCCSVIENSMEASIGGPKLTEPNANKKTA